MGLKNISQPRLPAAPAEYDPQYQEQFANVLRLYFNQLNSIAPVVFASSGVGTSDVVAGLSFAQPDPANPGQFKISLPTDADLANLRSGDVYYDTSGGVAATYPLRIKA